MCHPGEREGSKESIPDDMLNDFWGRRGWEIWREVGE